MFVDYYYLSSVNPGLVRHFEHLASELTDAEFVVDVGSNDGILLKPLKERGVKAIGVDPSVNVSKLANSAGLQTVVGFFDPKMADKIKRRYGKPDVIVASSVFTHVEDPHQFIEAAKSLLADGGRLVIEVEYIGNIIKHAQFERFYLDRVFYFSLRSLKELFKAHGMSITDAKMIEPHGGSLQVTAQKGRRPLSTGAARLLSREEKVLSRQLEQFPRRVEKDIAAFRKTLQVYKRSQLRVAGYGAPARLATICNYGKIGPELIDFVVDDSPLKHGRFTPGTHIPIVPSEHLMSQPPDVLVVFAYEYLDDIRKKINGNYRYLIPVPPREVT
jgi:SAM-dependent methyltransferase